MATSFVALDWPAATRFCSMAAIFAALDWAAAIRRCSMAAIFIELVSWDLLARVKALSIFAADDLDFASIFASFALILS